MALITGSRAAAEDAVQEALARAWERSEREQIESLPGWVTRVAMNLSKSKLRRMRVEARHRDAVAPPPAVDAGAASDSKIDIKRALAALPHRQREVTVLRYYLGLNVAEIAGALELNEGTVKTSLFRARKVLAAVLGEPVEEANDHVALG